MPKVDQFNRGVEDTPAEQLARRVREIRSSPVSMVPINALHWDDSPRVLGEDDAHVQRLAELESPLPPIIVHRETMTVVDGIHRVRASLCQGRERIAAHLFDGGTDEMFLLSVSMNVAHGLPLSTADRVNAVTRILSAHPQWSDRAVAKIAGVSARTVAETRRSSGAPDAASATRIGRDGRVRPLDAASGRERASELIRRDPTASLRQVAAAAGISPATARDVRNRLALGMDPVPIGRRAEAAKGAPGGNAPGPRPSWPEDERRSLAALTQLTERLRRDPSLRLTETGREVLRLLSVCTTAAKERQRIVSTIPVHCLGTLAEMMHGYAEIWRLFGEELDQARSLHMRQDAV